MPAAVKTSVTELPESRVRVEAEVPAEEIERRMQATARQLGRELRMPGFRKGKVPPPVVIQRIGRESVLDEAVRGAMGRWYLDAIDAAGIHPVGDPDLDVGDLPGEGQPLTFTIEIGVRPTATLGEYKGVEVGKREPGADDAAVDAELEALRERSARLETAEGAAATTATSWSSTTSAPSTARTSPGARGATSWSSSAPGAWSPASRSSSRAPRRATSATVTVNFPEDYGAAELAGREAQFAVTVKEVKRKELPGARRRLRLRRGRLRHARRAARGHRRQAARGRRARVEAEFREAVLDAVVRDATIDVPATLVDARAQELWERMLHSLSHRGIDKEAYLRISGRDEDEILEEAKPDAEQALRREAVIAAVIEAEDIEPSEGDILDALTDDGGARAHDAREAARPAREGRAAGRAARGSRPARRDRPAGRERDADIRERAQAREKLWTPGRQGSDDAPSRLWTPGARDCARGGLNRAGNVRPPGGRPKGGC